MSESEREDLVEPEGTNAGSAASTDEGPEDEAPAAVTRGGGDPGAAPDDGDPATTPSEDTALAAPAGDADGDSAQDAGRGDG